MTFQRIFPCLGFLGAALLFVQCTGGPADSSSSSSTSSSSGSSGSSTSSSSGASGTNNKPDEDPGVACTAVACANGLSIKFTMKTQGDYVFELTVDGKKTTCTATLPLTANPPTPCDTEGVLLGLSGSALPANQHALQDLTLTATTAQSITLKVTLNGTTVLGDKTFKPNWKTTPGPNGPQCEPKECKSATETFP